MLWSLSKKSSYRSTSTSSCNHAQVPMGMHMTGPILCKNHVHCLPIKKISKLSSMYKWLFFDHIGKGLNFTILILIHIFFLSFFYVWTKCWALERLIMQRSINFLLITHWSRNLTHKYVHQIFSDKTSIDYLYYACQANTILYSISWWLHVNLTEDYMTRWPVISSWSHGSINTLKWKHFNEWMNEYSKIKIKISSLKQKRELFFFFW